MPQRLTLTQKTFIFAREIISPYNYILSNITFKLLKYD